MLLSQSPSRSLVTLAAALVTSALMFTASTASARSNAIVYTAELAAPVEAANHIIRGTVIRCAGTECKGTKSGSSARSVCARLAHKVGPLESFSYKGEAMDEEALAKCND
ncbi:MAG: hypothetical protein AAGM33_04260 [Pseudomonadota bacterium]